MGADLIFILVQCEIAISSPRRLDRSRVRCRGEWSVRWLIIGSSEERLLIRWLRDALPEASIILHAVTRFSVLETNKVWLLCWEGAGVRALGPHVHLYRSRALKYLEGLPLRRTHPRRCSGVLDILLYEVVALLGRHVAGSLVMAARVPGRNILAHRGLPVARGRAQTDVLLVVEDELLFWIFEEEIDHLLFLLVGLQEVVRQQFIVYGGPGCAFVACLRQQRGLRSRCMSRPRTLMPAVLSLLLLAVQA